MTSPVQSYDEKIAALVRKVCPLCQRELDMPPLRTKCVRCDPPVYPVTEGT